MSNIGVIMNEGFNEGDKVIYYEKEFEVIEVEGKKNLKLSRDNGKEIITVMQKEVELVKEAVEEDLGADLLVTPPHKCDNVTLDEDLGADLLVTPPHKCDEVVVEEEVDIDLGDGLDDLHHLPTAEIEEDLGADLLETSTTTGDVDTTADMQGNLIKRDKNGTIVADEDFMGRPCFLVSDEDYLTMSIAKRSRGRYSIKDQRVIAFMREGGYRKPFARKAGNKILKVKF